MNSKKLLYVLINVFSNSGGCNIDIEKSLVFKYTSNKQLEIEIK